jgi:phage FluMu protein Com
MVEFTAGSAQVVVCGHCNTVVARKGLNFEDHGKIGRIVPTDSPLQLGADGRYARQAYRIVGHLQKDHGAGPWDEWYVEFQDGRTGWISESEGTFHLSFDSGVEEGVALADLHPGERLHLRNRAWVVEERGHGKVVAAEGQLPSDVDPTQDSYYVDATGPKGAFLTLDFGTRSHDPEVFIGQALKLEQLGIPADQLRPRVRKVELQQARCTQCNGPLELRAPDKTLRVACPYCGALLDASQGKLSFLRLLEKPDDAPLIPLGAKGSLDGTEWMCIGYMVRSCTVEGVRYPWAEYLLYNKARGFTWLMHSNGHWVYLKPLPAGDVSLSPGVAAFYEHRRYKAFQSVTAVTEAVQGEFYWQVNAGDYAQATEYVAPPYSLSVDATNDEVTYTHGEYLAPEVVKDAFKLKEPPPAPHGIAPSQPNPHKSKLVSTFVWTGIWLVGLLVLSGFFALRSANETVLEKAVVVPADAQPGTPGAMHFSDPFVLSKRGNMEAEVSASLDNEWLSIQGDLVNQETGEVVGFREELSYFHGRDDEGAWSEGNTRASATLSGVPAGRYVLRTTAAFEATSTPKPRTYSVKLVHDSPNGSWFCCAFILLLLGPVWALFRSHGFETQRWAESNLTDS